MYPGPVRNHGPGRRCERDPAKFANTRQYRHPSKSGATYSWYGRCYVATIREDTPRCAPGGRALLFDTLCAPFYSAVRLPA